MNPSRSGKRFRFEVAGDEGVLLDRILGTVTRISPGLLDEIRRGAGADELSPEHLEAVRAALARNPGWRPTISRRKVLGAAVVTSSTMVLPAAAAAASSYVPLNTSFGDGEYFHGWTSLDGLSFSGGRYDAASPEESQSSDDWVDVADLYTGSGGYRAQVHIQGEDGQDARTYNSDPYYGSGGGGLSIIANLYFSSGGARLLPAFAAGGEQRYGAGGGGVAAGLVHDNYSTRTYVLVAAGGGGAGAGASAESLGGAGGRANYYRGEAGGAGLGAGSGGGGAYKLTPGGGGSGYNSPAGDGEDGGVRTVGAYGGYALGAGGDPGTGALYAGGGGGAGWAGGGGGGSFGGGGPGAGGGGGSSYVNTSFSGLTAYDQVLAGRAQRSGARVRVYY